MLDPQRASHTLNNPNFFISIYMLYGIHLGMKNIWVVSMYSLIEFVEMAQISLSEIQVLVNFMHINFKSFQTNGCRWQILD
jgi:hypothetical protein